jgi:riboflavin-specific deaminase-like protein
MTPPLRAGVPMGAQGPGPAALAAWPLLLELARRRRAGIVPDDGDAFTLNPDGRWRAASGGEPAALTWREHGGWTLGRVAGATRDALELYLPLVTGSRTLAIGHLGQSVDGHIATESGDSQFVNGTENLAHLHRLRALADAVLVGPGTAARDDPRLTVRLVEGRHPVRVVLDPDAALPPALRVFTDGAASTLRVCGAARAAPAPAGGAETLLVAERNGRLDLAALLAALHARGLRVVFVEGGGKTVSDFLEADLLDRLQIAAAPLLMGAGRRGVQLPPTIALAACARPPHRVFRMGGDLLWDFDLRAEVAPDDPPPGIGRVL